MFKEAIDIAIASVTQSTLRQYECPLRKWNDFCVSKMADPFNINITIIQDFLTQVFKAGASYGTINTYRSALPLILG